MSDWTVHLIRIEKFGNHPNADSLSITQIDGQNVIFKNGTYKVGDLAVFLPPDTVMPMDPQHPLLRDNPHLKPGHRVDAVRLRGIFSNGFTVPASVLFTEEELKDIPVGTHVADRIGVTKYEDAGDKLSTSGENEKDPGYMPTYTDIDGWAKYRTKGIIKEGDEVVLLEKCHGCNARFTFRDNRLWVGSRTNIKAEYVRPDGTEGNLWWKVAKDLKLEDRFKDLNTGSLSTYGRHVVTSPEIQAMNFIPEDIVIYGEVFGQVQKGFSYGLPQGQATLRVFDSYSHKLGRYNDWNVTREIALNRLGLDIVPELYVGPWKTELEELRFGKETISGNSLHIREGFVLKPLKEEFVQFNPEQRHCFTGRKIFKFVSEDYKLRNK